MTVDERIAQLADTLQRLRSEDAGLRVFGAASHGYHLHPRLSEPEIRQFEAGHGVTLPDDYRLFLQRIGNGGPGPAYGLETLARAAQGCDPRSPFPFAQTARDHPDDVLDRWCDEPSGVLEICHHGCAIYSYLVVNGAPWGTVWNASGADVEPTGLGFLDWYEPWAEQALRRLRNERHVAALRVGMSTGEVMETVDGAWEKRTSADGTVTWFEAPGIPAQLEVDQHDRVIKITPWMFL